MSDLDYHQRKALRRIGRGKFPNRTMMDDPVIRQCYTTDHIGPPPDMTNLPFPQSMFVWCDWEAWARSQSPRLTDMGRELLSELDGVASC